MLNKKILFFILVFTFSSSYLSAKDNPKNIRTTNVGEAAIQVKIADSHCFFTKTDPFENKFINNITGLTRIFGNLLYVYADCEQANYTRAGIDNFLYPFGYSLQPYSVTRTDFKGKEKGAIRKSCMEIKNLTPEQSKLIYKYSEKKFKELDQNLKIKWHNNMSLIEETDEHCIFAQKAKINRLGRSEEIVTLGHMVIVEGKLFISYYADILKNEKDIVRMVRFLKSINYSNVTAKETSQKTKSPEPKIETEKTKPKLINHSTMMLDFSGQKVKFQIPEEFCYLKEADPKENALINLMKAFTEPKNKLKALFANCQSLKEVKTGNKKALYPIAIISQSKKKMPQSLKGKEILALDMGCFALKGAVQNMAKKRNVEGGNKAYADLKSKMKNTKLIDYFQKSKRYCTNGIIKGQGAGKSEGLVLYSMVLVEDQIFQVMIMDQLNKKGVLEELKNYMKQILKINNID